MSNSPCWPVPEGLIITSPYGWRWHPIHQEERFHTGIDFGGGGQHHPIYAVQSGTIHAKSFNNASGYYIIIKHTDDNYYSLYQHLKEPTHLTVGATVSKCQTIGIMGSSGDSTGIHLHLEISPNGSFWTEQNTVDPEEYLSGSIHGGDPWEPGENDWENFELIISRRFLPRRR